MSETGAQNFSSKSGDGRIATTLDKLICTFFGIGSIPFAPGTWGTAAGLVLTIVLVVISYAILGSGFVFWPIFIALQIALFIVANKSIERYIVTNGKHDPKEIVIDEVLGIAVTFTVSNLILLILTKFSLFTNQGYGSLATSLHYYVVMFLLFRLFDIWKPGIIGKLDKHNTGFGILMDDVVAGVFAGVASHILYIIIYLVF